MKLRAVCGSILEAESDCLILSLFEGEGPSAGPLEDLDRALDGAIFNLLRDGELQGKLNQVSVLHTLGKISPKRLMVAGMGERSRFSLDRLRQVAGTCLKKAKKMGAKRVTAHIPQVDPDKAGSRDLSQAFAEGAILGLYTFTKYKERQADEEVRELTVLDPDKARTDEVKRGVERGDILATSQNLARDLVNEPSNSVTPSALAERAEEVCKECGLRFQVLEKRDMERLGMGALLGVARGSEEPPKLIIMKYERQKDCPMVALVGKGITFDSGGISLKPPERMGRMKGDMGGGAAVIGAMRAISQLKPNVNVTGLVPATENMPSGHALKPGDVLKCSNGRTVEIISTDAEGRLILADALAYAVELGASKILDIATLTGGCVVALGELTSALLGNNQELIHLLLQVSEKTGERLWQLPMFEEYRKQLKSEVADIKNTGGRSASTITAAIFLKEFVQSVPWVHLDIAGKEFPRDDFARDKGYLVEGGTGVGTRTLAQLVCELAGSGSVG